MGLFGDIAAGITGAANSIYNMFTNKRDFDYQKALQQTMFEREDNAVQRRMADLQAAGINPNLAAGSAAAAGSVVSRSNTNDVNMGAALDYIQAKNNILMQKRETEIKEKEYELLNEQTKKFQQDWIYERAQQLFNLGFNPKISFGNDGKLHLQGAIKTNNFSDTYLGQQFKYNFDSLKNSAEMLQKDLDFYNVDKYAGYILPLLKLIR